MRDDCSEVTNERAAPTVKWPSLYMKYAWFTVDRRGFYIIMNESFTDP